MSAARVTLLGLGQIGASIGMALGSSKGAVRRIGWDSDAKQARTAQSLGAVDEIRNPAEAVKEAGLILLCVPLSEMRDVLQRIGPNLPEGAVVMDTAPVKQDVLQWAGEFIPQGRFYLGLLPALAADSLSASESGPRAARPDLFRRSIMVIDAPPHTPERVIELAFGLSRLLGAKPMLADFAESDGLMTSVHLLPQLTAAALLNATVEQPGWAEARKLAGRPYASVAKGLEDDLPSLAAAALGNRAALVHALDVLLASLKGLRDDIEQGDEDGVRERLQYALDSRQRWMAERTAAEWLHEGGADFSEIPDMNERLSQMLFGSALAPPGKKRK